MDFWNTEQGHRLADVLIATLPKMADIFTGIASQTTSRVAQGILITDSVIDSAHDIIQRGGRVVAVSGNVIIYEEAERNNEETAQ